MLIVSKFHDYYDSVSNLGVDKSIVYNRENKEICTDLKDIVKVSITKHVHSYNLKSAFSEFSISSNIGRTFNLRHINFGTIGFCGELFNFIIVDNVNYTNPPSIHYINDDNIDTLVDSISTDHKIKIPHIKNSIKKKFQAFLSYSKLIDTTLFQTYNTPIFLIQKKPNYELLELNPCLKDYDFFKIKDSYTTFQDILMFINEQLTNKEVIKEAPNDTKILSHGFDLKSSFRNTK